MNPDHRQESNWANAEGFRLLIEGVKEFAIFLLSPERVVLVANEGVTSVLGYSRQEFVGTSGDLIFTEEDRAAGIPERELLNAARDGQARDERWHVRKDGRQFWASGVVTKVCDSSGKLLGFSKVMADRTTERRTEELLRQSRSELEMRVAERTRELSEALESLQNEIAQREALEIALLEARERERENLGQELHDGICQHLQGAALIASVLARRLPKPESEELRRIEHLIRDGSEQVRNVARGLTPFVFRSIGLRTALTELAEHTCRIVPCRFEDKGNIDAGDGPALHLYRIAQEAVNNSIKQSGATAITITLAQENGEIVLSIVDDGVKTGDMSVEVPGMGLYSLRQRARMLGGTLNVEPLGSGGTRVSCTVPTKALKQWSSQPPSS